MKSLIKCEEELKTQFAIVDEIAYYNQKKVLNAFIKLLLVWVFLVFLLRFLGQWNHLLNLPLDI